MTTDYNKDRVAEQYRQAKEQPWRWAVETYSLMGAVGDLRGKRVVDVACGTGFFTRKLREAGAREVLGIDISERMIDLARAEEASRPLGIEYVVEDARAEEPRRDFDLAAAAWLLVYAHDRAELGQFCRGLARLLRPGGRFVTYTTNPDVYHFDPPDYRKYGFDLELADHAYEGAPIDFTIDVGDSKLAIQNYYLPIEAYHSEFEKAGFGNFKVSPPSLAPEAEAELGAEFWRDFMECPIAILMEAEKGR
jgi:toxoflavin synthase